MEGGGAQNQVALDWAPSCCGLTLVRDPDSGPSCLLEMALGLGRVQAEVSLPSGGQEWTSLRGSWECLAAARSPVGGRGQRGYGKWSDYK